MFSDIDDGYYYIYDLVLLYNIHMRSIVDYLMEQEAEFTVSQQVEEGKTRSQ